MNMRHIVLPVILLAVLALASCGNPPAAEVEESFTLTPEDRELCASQHIDSSVIILLRVYTHSTLNAFEPDSVWTYDDDFNSNVRASRLEGVMFSATSDLANSYCRQMGPALNEKGCTIYVFEQNFGIDNEKDKIAIVNTADKYEVLREMATDGINYDIDNDSVISIIKDFDAKYDLTLTGAGLDWCQFSIGKEPGDWQRMAEEVYKVCPDVVDQGTGTVEDLAAELQQYKTLYLWWD